MDTWLLLRSAMQKKEGCANLVSSHWYYPMTLLPVAALDVRGTNVGGHGFFKKSNKSKSASQFYEDCMHEDQKENRDLRDTKRITTASVILWRTSSPDYRRLKNEGNAIKSEDEHCVAGSNCTNKCTVMSTAP